MENTLTEVSDFIRSKWDLPIFIEAGTMVRYDHGNIVIGPMNNVPEEDE